MTPPAIAPPSAFEVDLGGGATPVTVAVTWA